MRSQRLLERLLRGAVRNVRFQDVEVLLEDLGFQLVRTRGSHHIYTHPKIPRALPLQPVNGEAKPYQLRQLAKLVAEYNLLEDADP